MTEAVGSTGSAWERYRALARVVGDCASSPLGHFGGPHLPPDSTVSWVAWDAVQVGLQIVPNRERVVPWAVLQSGRVVAIPGLVERANTVAEIEALVAEIDGWVWSRLPERFQVDYAATLRERTSIARPIKDEGLRAAQDGEWALVPGDIDRAALVREVFGPWARVEGFTGEHWMCVTLFEAFEMSLHFETSERARRPVFTAKVDMSLNNAAGLPLLSEALELGAGPDRYIVAVRRRLGEIRQWCLARLPEGFIAELERGYGRSVDDRSGVTEMNREVDGLDAVRPPMEVVGQDALFEVSGSRWREVQSTPGVAAREVVDRLLRPVAREAADRGAVKLRADPRTVVGQPLLAEQWRILRDDHNFVFVPMAGYQKQREPVASSQFVGWAVPLTREGLEVPGAWVVKW